MNAISEVGRLPVGVVGAGLAGLAAACTLAARGHTVALFDKNPWLGGKAAVLNEGGFRFDMGPTILTVPGVLEPGEQLAMRRSAECYVSAAALGAKRVEFLGFTDSGMMGEPSNDAPFCFWQADIEYAARTLAVILDEEEPRLLAVSALIASLRREVG